MVKQLLCVVLIFTLAGCSLFGIRHPIVEQGNVITKENVSKLHKGMSPSEVVAIMGTPVIVHTFTANRIDYAYTFNDSERLVTEKHVTCIFTNNRLTSIDTSGV